jgi:hypothetical protein
MRSLPLTNLCQMMLPGTPLAAPMPSLCTLTQLSHLALTLEGAWELPDSFSCLTALVYLDLSRSRCLAVPGVVGGLTQLTMLCLR